MFLVGVVEIILFFSTELNDTSLSFSIDFKNGALLMAVLLPLASSEGGFCASFLLSRFFFDGFLFLFVKDLISELLEVMVLSVNDFGLGLISRELSLSFRPWYPSNKLLEVCLSTLVSEFNDLRGMFPSITSFLLFRWFLTFCSLLSITGALLETKWCVPVPASIGTSSGFVWVFSCAWYSKVEACWERVWLHVPYAG